MYYAVVRSGEQDPELMVNIYNSVINGLDMGRKVLEAYKSALLDPGCVGEELIAQLEHLRRMFGYEPRWLIPTDEGEVLAWTTAACRRNLCSGRERAPSAISCAMAIMR